MQYYVYMIACADKSLYTGYTTDLAYRMKQHNGEVPGGAKYTRSRRPVSLVYHEECTSQQQAMQRECEIKRFSRTAKLALCATDSVRT